MLERYDWKPERLGSDRYDDKREFISVSDIQRFLKRYWRTVAACIAAAVFIAIIFIATATPIYTARVQVLIETSVPHTFRSQMSENYASLDASQVESQLAILRSDRIAGKVVERLGLLETPANAEQEPSTATALLSELRETLSRIKAALLFWVPGTNTKVASQANKLQSAIAHLRSRVVVRREGLSYAINISYQSTDPQAAAKIANAIAHAYVEDRLATRARALEQGSRWLQDRIGDLRKQMNVAALDVQKFKAKRDYRILSGKANAVSSQAERGGVDRKAQPGNNEHTLEDLQSRADTYRKIYESYLQAHAENVQKQSYPITNARVITPATPPSRASHPRPLMTLAIAIVIGGLMGLGIAFMRNSLDRKLRTPRQVRNELGIECLGQVARLDMKVRRRVLRHLKSKLPGHSMRAADIGYRLTEVRDLPFSRFSESVKRVRTAISLSTKNRRLRTIGITSAIPKEGKSTFICNLATLYSIANARVLLVDADVHNSTLSRILAPDREIGLIEAVNGAADVSQCIVQRDADNPDILPIAAKNTVFDSAGLLGSDTMRHFIERLRENYDLIFFDLAPLKPISDGLEMCSLLDAVILVSEWGSTPIPLLTEAVHELRRADSTILGLVLTKSEEGFDSTYGGRSRLSEYMAHN